MALRASNNAWGLLSTAMNSQTTALTLQAGNSARFPVLTAGDWFYITVTDTNGNVEIMKVTATSADQFIVVRGVDGSTAQPWSAGVRVQLNITSQAWLDLQADLAALPAQQRTFAAPVTLSADPTSSLHATSMQYVINNKLNKSVPIQLPIGFSPVKQLSNHVYMGWSSGEFYAQIDSTFMGNCWRDSTFNPASKANTGSQLQWNSGIYQSGAVSTYGGFTLDFGSPWVMEGYTANMTSSDELLYLRAIWFRNQ